MRASVDSSANSFFSDFCCIICKKVKLNIEVSTLKPAGVRFLSSHPLLDIFTSPYSGSHTFFIINCENIALERSFQGARFNIVFFV